MFLLRNKKNYLNTPLIWSSVIVNFVREKVVGTEWKKKRTFAYLQTLNFSDNYVCQKVGQKNFKKEIFLVICTRSFSKHFFTLQYFRRFLTSAN